MNLTKMNHTNEPKKAANPKSSWINALPAASRIHHERSNPNPEFGARSRQRVTGLQS
jgi:hypothetical protein